MASGNGKTLQLLLGIELAIIQAPVAGVPIGTAYLLSPETNTGAVHRAALKGEAAREKYPSLPHGDCQGELWLAGYSLSLSAAMATPHGAQTWRERPGKTADGGFPCQKSFVFMRPALPTSSNSKNCRWPNPAKARYE